jgi:hypothetical protein
MPIPARLGDHASGFLGYADAPSGSHLWVAKQARAGCRPYGHGGIVPDAEPPHWLYIGRAHSPIPETRSFSIAYADASLPRGDCLGRNPSNSRMVLIVATAP